MKSKKTLEEIIRTLKRHEAVLQRKYGVKKIGVFGSVARKEPSGESDLDLLVEFNDDVEMGLLRFVELENYLGTLLEMKVDLVEKTALKPLIGKHVVREVIYT